VSRQTYFVWTRVLDPALYPSRTIEEDIVFDRMYVDLNNTTATLDNVVVGIDYLQPLTLSLIASGLELKRLVNGVEVAIPERHRVRVSWNSSEDGKVLSLIFGREAGIVIKPPQTVSIASDKAGLAKDSTLSKLVNALSSVSADTVLVKISGSGIMVPVDIQGDAIGLSSLVRYGRTPSVLTWVYGSEVSAPSAGASLVSRSVGSGKKGYVYGFFITASEANDFYINWTSGGTAHKVRIKFTGAGSLEYAGFIPVNEGLPADSGSTVSITVVNAGSSGSVYQAGLLYVEV